MKKLFVAALAIFATIPLSFAQQSQQQDTIKLRDVVVVESQKAPVQLLPLAVTTVNSSEIQKSTESSLLPVLVNRVPGLFVTERGIGGYGVSGGAAGATYIRGVGDGNKVLFMIDGQPQWAGLFGHSLPDTYTTADVDHVEVVRGPSSLLYGSGAMGGSVNIITKHAKEEGFSGHARAMFGSHYTQKYALNAGYNKSGFNAFAAAAYERSHGARKGMEYWLASQYASLSYTFSSHWKVGSDVTLMETKPHNAGSLQAPLENMWTQVVRGTSSIYIKNSYDRSSGGVQAYYGWGNHIIDDGNTPGQPERNYLFHSHDYNMGVTAFQTVKPWTGNNLSLGVDFKHWGGESFNALKDHSGTTPGYKKHVNEIAGYVMMQQDFIGDKLSLNAGVRLEHSSQFGNEWAPQAGFVARPFADSQVKFSYGKGFRSPNIRELYMYVAANPDLKPEYMNNYEVELRQYFLNRSLNVGLSLYYIQGKDMIQTVMVNGRGHNENVGRFINKGFEVDAAYQVNDKWTVDANYSFLYTDANILYAPKHKVFAEVMFSPGHWQFSLESLSVFGLIKQAKPLLKEHYSLLNARVAFTIDQPKFPCTLFCKAENITNAKYEIVNGFPMPGATVMAGIDITF